MTLDAQTVRDAKERAEKALRTPDLEWAHGLVHGLANDVLGLVASVEALTSERESGAEAFRRKDDHACAFECERDEARAALRAAEARVVALTAERDDAVKEAVDLARYATDVAATGEAAYRITTTRTNAAEARLLSLEEALRRYGWHREGCGYSGSSQPESCTCGFNTALAASVGDTT